MNEVVAPKMPKMISLNALAKEDVFNSELNALSERFGDLRASIARNKNDVPEIGPTETCQICRSIPMKDCIYLQMHLLESKMDQCDPRSLSATNVHAKLMERKVCGNCKGSQITTINRETMKRICMICRCQRKPNNDRIGQLCNKCKPKNIDNKDEIVTILKACIAAVRIQGLEGAVMTENQFKCSRYGSTFSFTIDVIPRAGACAIKFTDQRIPGNRITTKFHIKLHLTEKPFECFDTLRSYMILGIIRFESLPPENDWTIYGPDCNGPSKQLRQPPEQERDGSDWEYQCDHLGTLFNLETEGKVTESHGFVYLKAFKRTQNEREPYQAAVLKGETKEWPEKLIQINSNKRKRR